VLLSNDLVSNAPEDFPGSAVDDDYGADASETGEDAIVVERVYGVYERVVFAGIVWVENIFVGGKVLGGTPLPEEGTSRHVYFSDDVGVDNRSWRLAAGNTALDRMGRWMRLESGVEQTAVAIVVSIVVSQGVAMFPDDTSGVVELLHNPPSIFLSSKYSQRQEKYVSQRTPTSKKVKRTGATGSMRLTARFPPGRILAWRPMRDFKDHL
jgi:hypothetical protein